MRTSPLRTTVAVLRTTIGLTQKELAKLVKRATRTIQAVELGILPLSEKLAKDIAAETGVDLEWLMQNDPTATPLKREKTVFNPTYTRRDYELLRAVIEMSRSEGEAENATDKMLRDQLPPAYCSFKVPLVAQKGNRLEVSDLDAQTVEAVSQLLEITRGRTSGPLVRWKLRKALQTIAKEDAIGLEFEGLPYPGQKATAD